MTLQNVTVIIPAHNRPERLRRLLDYLAAQISRFLFPTHPTIRLPMRRSTRTSLICTVLNYISC